MLMWMDGTLTDASDPERFAAFAARAVTELGFDPTKKSRQDAAARLVQHQGAWGMVWHRFEEAGGAYEGVVKLLMSEEPPDLLTPPTSYPRENSKREVVLRRDLMELAKLDYAKAAARLRELEKDHSSRRSTVWAARGDAPLAMALEHLVYIANTAALPAHDAEDLANAYVEFGWKADAAALKALGIARIGQERDAIVAALRAVYLPWLDQGAKALQDLAGSGGVAWPVPAKPPLPPQGAVLLFVDGLRMDLGQDLAALLRGRGANVELSWRWSGFPTITATCKALVSPAAGTLKAGPVGDLVPATADGKAATKPVLYKAIEAAGWITQQTLLLDGPIWRECGRFDEEGHARGSRMAEGVPDGLREVAEIVLRLAEQGRRVRIVTDHGWLLMPGGFQQAALETGLVEPSGKRSRMATLKPGAPTSYLRLPWTWDSSVSVAVPTGARTFIAGQEYAHGGVSPQECVLPMLDIDIPVAVQQVSIKSTWQRLRLKVEVIGGAGMMFDVRLGSDTSSPSILPKGPRALDDFGHLGVLIGDEYEGKEVCLVVHPPGKPQDVLAKRVEIIEG
jgi:hypothetical protein